MSGVAQGGTGFELLEKRMAIDDAVKAIAAQNPKFAQAIVLKEYFGLSVAAINHWKKQAVLTKNKKEAPM